MTPTREELLRLLEAFGDRYPEWRFGQLVANVSFMARGPVVESIWDVEDEEFVAAMREHLEKRRAQDRVEEEAPLGPPTGPGV